MSTATQAEDLKKLTVPQLKALCKDKKITGYSKLGKNAIIQKLVEHSGSVSKLGSLPSNSGSIPAIDASPRVPTTSTIGTNTSERQCDDGTKGLCIDHQHSQILQSDKQQNSSASPSREPTTQRVLTPTTVGTNNERQRDDGTKGSCTDLRQNQTLPSLDKPRNSSTSRELTSFTKQANTGRSEFSSPSRVNCSRTTLNLLLSVIFTYITEDPLVASSLASVVHEQSYPADQLAPSRKRPFEPSEPVNVASKHRRPLDPPGISCTTTTQRPVFKVPVIPASRKSTISKPSTSLLCSRVVARPGDPGIRTHPLQPGPTPSTTSAVKRFVPLVVQRVIPSAVPGNVPCTTQPPPKVHTTITPSPLQYLDFPVAPTLSLTTISFPPSLSQRKQLTRLAVLLSGVSFEQLKDCVQVSRLFRYAGMPTTEPLLASLIG